MNQELGIRNFKYLLIGTILIAFDQSLKYLIRHFGGFYICNSGISWGIVVNDYIFAIFWIIFVSILLLFLLKPAQILNFKSKAAPYLFILILSGAISNLIDRFTYGCVVDFIDLKFWPVFNLADIFIVLGAVFLLVKWKKI